MPRRRPSLLSTAVPLAAGLWLLWRVRAPGEDTSWSGHPERAEPGPAPTMPASPPTHATSASSAAPTLSVVIPARNEETALPSLLRSLRVQTRPADEIIVVDDHSDDATGTVAADGGAQVLTPPPLPDGWVGKTWACHHGAGAAHGDILVFLDADVTLADDALGRLLVEHADRGGLVSVQPSHRTEAVHEQLSAVCNVVAMMGTGAFTGPPSRHPDMAFGPCLLLGRGDYDATGGHAHPTVRLQVAEDIALARRMRALDRPVTVLAGRDTVSFRMYPEGLGQLTAGWSKMLANGARRAPVPIGLAVAVWVTGALLGARSGGVVVAALVRRRRTPGLLRHATVYALWATQMGWLFARVGRWRRSTAIAFPLPLAAFVGLVGRSAVLLVRRRPATWHGRPVPVG
jgi:4,4'-diaponeurosporenoate glycosyltransferase